LLSCKEKSKAIEYKEKIVHVNDSTTSHTLFHKNGVFKAEGHKIDKIEVGDWKYYDSLGIHVQTTEFLNIDDKPYTNQTWFFDDKKDTLEMGNHYQLTMNDTIVENQLLRVMIFLKQPFFAYDTETFLLIDNKNQTNKTFSNRHSVSWDTIRSLATTYPKNKDMQYRNQAFVFDIEPYLTGSKEFRSILVEKLEKKSDSVDFVTREIFIIKKYHVKSIRH
ncbi:MAG: hypothetical protein NWQ19_10305, partial [Nonlabens sp.]|nr:hypothetical protein [Nonlabens sp.]